MFDESLALNLEMEWILGIHIRLKLHTDSNFLFDIICSASKTSKKRTIIDASAEKRGSYKKTMTYNGLVRGTEHIAYGLSNRNPREHLQDVIKSNRVNFTFQQWIIRREL